MNGVHFSYHTCINRNAFRNMMSLFDNYANNRICLIYRSFYKMYQGTEISLYLLYSRAAIGLFALYKIQICITCYKVHLIIFYLGLNHLIRDNWARRGSWQPAYVRTPSPKAMGSLYAAVLASLLKKLSGLLLYFVKLPFWTL